MPNWLGVFPKARWMLASVMRSTRDGKCGWAELKLGGCNYWVQLGTPRVVKHVLVKTWSPRGLSVPFLGRVEESVAH